MDGQPLANALVGFQPIATKDNQNPGPGSYGKTDAEGRYTLRVVGTNADGAVVGRHRVSISKYADGNAPGDEKGGGRGSKQLIPDQFNADTKLTCEVPPEGKANADFDISIPSTSGRR